MCGQHICGFYFCCGALFCVFAFPATSQILQAENHSACGVCGTSVVRSMVDGSVVGERQLMEHCFDSEIGSGERNALARARVRNSNFPITSAIPLNIFKGDQKSDCNWTGFRGTGRQFDFGAAEPVCTACIFHGRTSICRAAANLRNLSRHDGPVPVGFRSSAKPHVASIHGGSRKRWLNEGANCRFE